MFIKKVRVFLPGLVLAALLIGLSGCSTNASSQASANNVTGNGPDHVQIQIDDHLPKGGKPVVTLSIVSMVQQLYTTTFALPQMPELQSCTLELGRDYTLVFLRGEKTLASVVAQRYGCGVVTIAGENQNRQATQDFWSQLDQAIFMATPVAKP